MYSVISVKTELSNMKPDANTKEATGTACRGLAECFDTMTAWIFMFVLAFAFYAGCKRLTNLSAVGRGVKLPARLGWIYLFLWPGVPWRPAKGESDPGSARKGVA